MNSLIILMTFILFSEADRISTKRLCADRNCETVISKARTLARHKPKDPFLLPFERGEIIFIYSKSAGTRPDLWGGECNGKRGYFPRSFVRETKVEQPNPTHEVDTEVYHFVEKVAEAADIEKYQLDTVAADETELLDDETELPDESETELLDHGARSETIDETATDSPNPNKNQEQTEESSVQSDVDSEEYENEIPDAQTENYPDETDTEIAYEREKESVADTSTDLTSDDKDNEVKRIELNSLSAEIRSSTYDEEAVQDDILDSLAIKNNNFNDKNYELVDSNAFVAEERIDYDEKRQNDDERKTKYHNEGFSYNEADDNRNMDNSFHSNDTIDFGETLPNEISNLNFEKQGILTSLQENQENKLTHSEEDTQQGHTNRENHSEKRVEPVEEFEKMLETDEPLKHSEQYTETKEEKEIEIESEVRKQTTSQRTDKFETLKDTQQVKKKFEPTEDGASPFGNMINAVKSSFFFEGKEDSETFLTDKGEQEPVVNMDINAETSSEKVENGGDHQFEDTLDPTMKYRGSADHIVTGSSVMTHVQVIDETETFDDKDIQTLNSASEQRLEETETSVFTSDSLGQFKENSEPKAYEETFLTDKGEQEPVVNMDINAETSSEKVENGGDHQFEDILDSTMKYRGSADHIVTGSSVMTHVQVIDETETFDEKDIQTLNSASEQRLEETETSVFTSDSLGQFKENSEPKAYEEALSIVIDGTVLPADKGVLSYNSQQPLQSASFDSAAVDVATYKTVDIIQPTHAEKLSEEISQLDSKSHIQSTYLKETEGQEPKELTIQETKSAGIVLARKDDADLLTEVTESSKMELHLQLEKVSDDSVVPSRQSDSQNKILPTQTVSVSPFINTKPLVMHKTDLMLSASSVLSDLSSLDHKKFEIPYQASTKIMPLNQGPDVNNRYTSSSEYTIIEKSVDTTLREMENSEIYGIQSDDHEADLNDTDNHTFQSESVQDQVQPLLSKDPYKADDFASRKILFTKSVKNDRDGVQLHILKEEDSIQQTECKSDKVAEKIPFAQPVGKPLQPEEIQNQAFENHHQIPETTDNSAQPTYEPKVDENNNIVDSNLQIETTETKSQPDDMLTTTSETSLLQKMEPQLKLLVDMLPATLQSVLEHEPLGLSPVLTLLFSILSSSILALITCCSCFRRKGAKSPRRADPLAIITSLEEQLFVAIKEKENLEDYLQMKSNKVKELEKDLDSQQTTTGSVETDLRSLQSDNITLQRQLSVLQEELKNYKQKTEEKDKKIKAAYEQLSKDKEEMEDYSLRTADLENALQKANNLLIDKNTEISSLQSQIQNSMEQIQHLETRKQQLTEEAAVWSERVDELTEQVEQSFSEKRRLQEDVTFKESELEVLRDCFLQLKAFQEEDEMREDSEHGSAVTDKLKAMLDVSRVEASLQAVEEERSIIQNRLKIEEESRREMEDQIESLKRKLETNHTDKMKAERQCQEAQTKLEVLSKYFKEKEAELTRQLGEQEVLKNQNISKLEFSGSITKQLEQENETYRRQVDDLNAEITKAERDFRSQIAANEKKAHENWLATRAAERELKESRHECAVLRQKLTELERKLLHGPAGLIRPITTRGIPPPGIINGGMPPPLHLGIERPVPERPGSRGSVQGRVTPRHREDDPRGSPSDPERPIPPQDRRLPPGMPRPPPPHMDIRSPPPYAMRPPPPLLDRRSPQSFDRYPIPHGPRQPFPPPHLIRGPPPSQLHSPTLEQEDTQGPSVSPYNRQPQSAGSRDTARHQSQV